MDMQFVEQFIAGSDEINRQRKVITRVINFLISLIRKYFNECGKKWGREEKIFGVQLSWNVELLYRVGSIDLYFSGIRWQKEGGESFYFGHIPSLYSQLSKIVEAADVAIPEARIMEDFDFFIGQAPVNKLSTSEE